MAFELDISGASRGILRVADFPDLAREPIRRVLKEVADAVRADAAASIGRAGRRSLPGSPPASDTGALLRSLRTRLARSRKRDERAYAIAPEFYGFMLESGTRRIRPRPFIVPAAQRHLGEFVAKVQAVIDDAARQVSS
jgi:hypothetical protein